MTAEVEDGRGKVEQVPHELVDRHRPLRSKFEIVATRGQLQLAFDGSALLIERQEVGPHRIGSQKQDRRSRHHRPRAPRRAITDATTAQDRTKRRCWQCRRPSRGVWPRPTRAGTSSTKHTSTHARSRRCRHPWECDFDPPRIQGQDQYQYVSTHARFRRCSCSPRSVTPIRSCSGPGSTPARQPVHAWLPKIYRRNLLTEPSSSNIYAA
jgi:hypothetical protein